MKRFNIKIESSNRDTYPNNFKVWVYITDNSTGKTVKRRGNGKYIGNFAPIWVNLNSKSYQLTELERLNIGDE